MDKNYLCEIKTNSIYIDAAFMHLKKKVELTYIQTLTKKLSIHTKCLYFLFEILEYVRSWSLTRVFPV